MMQQLKSNRENIEAFTTYSDAPSFVEHEELNQAQLFLTEESDKEHM